MVYILLFIAVIVIFAIRASVDEKIDKEEQVQRQTPGRFSFLRDNFGGLLDSMKNDYGWSVIKERNNMANVGPDDEEYVSFTCWSQKFVVAYVNNRSVIRQWEFGRGVSSQRVYSEIKPYMEISFEKVVRKKFENKFDEYMRVNCQKYESMNDPYVGKLMKETALISFYKDLTSPQSKAMVAPMFERHGLDFDTIVEDEYLKALNRYTR